MGPSFLRTFLAVPLGEIFLPEITSFLETARASVEGIKWARPEGTHATLHFFGPTTGEELPQIRHIVTPLAAACPPLELSLGEVGFFPNLHKPRIVWIGVEGDLAPLKAFHRDLERNLRKRGFSIEDRPFRVHVTVGRSRQGARSAEDLGRLVFPATDARRIDKFVLYQSHLGPEGSRYEPLEIFPLAG